MLGKIAVWGALVVSTAGLLRAQAPASTENLPTPQARTLFEQPRDGLPLLLRVRETYDNCASYHAQGAVRIVVYEETKKAQSFLFQDGGGSTRKKRYKLFSTSFTRSPFALHHEIISMGAGRSFTSVDFWSGQRHAVDHYSSSPLPMTSDSLAAAIRENNYLLLNYDPAPEWLLASNDSLAPALVDKADWLMSGAKYPRDVWWVGEEALAGVQTDILTWRTSAGDSVSLWLTREPLAIVKVMAERMVESEYTNVTALIQPEFGVAIADSNLALNRPRPDFFNVDPATIVFGPLELPPVPEKTTPMAPTASSDFISTPRTTTTPTPPASTNENAANSVGVAEANSTMSQLPGAQVQAVVAEEQAPQNTLLTPEQLAAIVVIQGDQGVGTGFFCNIRGRNFIITSQHMLTGSQQLDARTVDGTPIRAKDIYGAIGHDIAMIAVDDAPAALIAATSVDESTNASDPIVAPGSKLGGGVLTQVKGSVTSIGPDRVELNAAFVPGNSGSPIINLDTGEVIAVATYVTQDQPDSGTNRSAGRSVHWFGYRIDSVAQWEQINWYKWQRQYEMMQKFSDDSLAIYNFINNRREFYNNPELSRLYNDYLEDLRAPAQRSDDNERKTKLFIQKVINFAKIDLDDISKTQYYDYFKSTAGPKENVVENVAYRHLVINHLTTLRDENWRDIFDRVNRRAN